MTISPVVGKFLAVTGQEHSPFQALAPGQIARKVRLSETGLTVRG